MSSALLWEVLRNRSSFLFKSRKTDRTFSRESCNLTGVNSRGASGLVNRKAVGIEAIRDKKGASKGIALVTRRNGAFNKPMKSFVRVELKRDSRRAMKAIKGATKKNHYRQDLTKNALRRASIILRGQKAVTKKVGKSTKAK